MTATTLALEPDVIRRAQKGDATAFGAIVESYQKPIYNLCYRLLGDAREAEDAAQETFLRAYYRLSSYDCTRSLTTWLLSIAHNHCIDRLRKRRPTWLEIADEATVEQPALSDPVAGPEEAALQSEHSQQMQAMLNRLAPQYRDVLVMRYWYDLSYEEVAEATDTSVGAVKSRLFRAREAIARLLTTEPDPAPRPTSRSTPQAVRAASTRRGAQGVWGGQRA
jgi:RNA polymerase sigma-70 factor, ECF subfamily